MIAPSNIQQKLQIFQNKCLKICKNLPIWKKILNLYNISSIQPLQTRLRSLSTNYFRKVLYFNPLFKDEYIFYKNDRVSTDGANLTIRKPYTTSFCKLSNLILI